MRAVVCDGAGGPEVLAVRDVPDPQPGAGEVLVDVAATAVNRADLLQRQGHYPPPPGASEVLGLECSGTVAALGPGAERYAVGDEVVALLAGGGYAERVAVPQGQVLPRPGAVDLVRAAALPEVVATVWSNVVMTAGLRADELLLVHGGAGGIGTVAVQVGRALGARVAVTAGSAAKLEVCSDLGASVLIDYRTDDFVEAVRAASDGRGADVVLDNMGASYLERNVQSLATGGRLVVIGMQGGRHGDLDLARLLSRRASVTATSLRARPLTEKAAIMAEVERHVWPLLADGSIRPVVHATYPLAEVRAAHEALDDGSHVGKVLLTV